VARTVPAGRHAQPTGTSSLSDALIISRNPGIAGVAVHGHGVPGGSPYNLVFLPRDGERSVRLARLIAAINHLPHGMLPLGPPLGTEAAWQPANSGPKRAAYRAPVAVRRTPPAA
jgi:hypothetical protein